MAKSAKSDLTSKEIIALLRQRYAAPEWAFFSEVANGTGLNGNRRIDGLAMNLYPSRGLLIHGFEVKVSRSDLLRELKDPDKAEAIARYCHHWWIVAPTGIAGPDELPAPWGLLEASRGSLTATKPPAMLGAQPPSYEFMAAVFRRAAESSADSSLLKAQFDLGYQRGWDAGNETRNRRVDPDTKRLTALLESIDRFQKVSGVHIDEWNGERVGKSFKAFLAEKRLRSDAKGALERARSAYEQIVTIIESEQSPAESSQQGEP